MYTKFHSTHLKNFNKQKEKQLKKKRKRKPRTTRNKDIYSRQKNVKQPSL